MSIQPSQKDGIYIRPFRPNRRRIRYFVKYYPFLVGVLISLVVLFSLILVDVKLMLLLLTGYWVYLLLKIYFRKNKNLGEIYHHPIVQLLRVLSLVIGVTFLLIYVYTKTDYLIKVQDDFLWLLYLPAISATSQRGSRQDYFLVMVFVIICLYLIHPAINTLAGILKTSPTSDFFIKSIWLILISSTSYILLRYTSDTVANLNLIINVQNRMREMEGSLLRSRTSLSENSFIEKAVEIIKNDLYYDHVNVFRLDQYNENLTCIAGACDQGKRLAKEGFRVNIADQNSIIGHVINLGTPYRSNNVNDDPHYLSHNAFPITQSELVVPIVVRNRLYGVLDIQVHQADYFLDQDIQAIQILANHIGWVIDNSEQFEHISWVNRIVETIAAPIFTQNDLDETLQEIANSAAVELSADLVFLYSYDPNTKERIFGPIYAGDLLHSDLMDATTADQDNVVFRLIDNNEHVYINENLDKIDINSHVIFKPSPTHKRTGKPTFIEREEIKSNVIIQLINNGQCVGVLFLNFRKARKFSLWDQKRYLSFADFAALAIQKMQLQHHAIQKEKTELINLNHTLIGSTVGLFKILKSINLKSGKLNEKNLQEKLSQAVNVTEELHNDIRWIDRMLKEEVFDDLMLELEKFVKLLQQVFKVKVEIVWIGEYSLIPRPLAKELYIVIREALTNSVRHGRAKNIIIKNQIKLTVMNTSIIDNGVGFNPKLIKRQNGLFIMKYLIKKTDGAFKISSKKGKGTKVVFQVPLKKLSEVKNA